MRRARSPLPDRSSSCAGRRLTTAAHLAGRLGVSLRTVYRDVRDLSLSGGHWRVM